MATKKRRTSTRGRKQKARQPGRWRSLPWRRAGLVVCFALAALVMLALLAPGTGALSRGVATLLLRLLGWAAYLVAPVAAGALYRLGIKRRGLNATRSLGALITLLGLLVLTHLARRLPNPFVLSVAGYGGGLFGWAISAFMLSAAGRVGAYLFSLAILSIGALLAFDLSLSRIRMWIATGRDRMRRGRHGSSAKRPRLSDPGTRRNSRPLRPRARRLPVPLPDPETEREVPRQALPSGPALAIAPVPPKPSAVATPAERPGSGWQLPDSRAIFRLVDEEQVDEGLVRQRARIIEETLHSLGVPAEVVDWQKGPAVTQFAVKPGVIEKRGRDGQPRRMRVRVAKIAALADDLALALSASPVRIQAPIPDRSAVGVEVPNPRTQVVSLGSVFFSQEFQRLGSPLALALGRDISGRPVVADLDKMPHLLMAGATNAGKSVCVNAIICCLLARNTPATLRLALVDPKRVELAGYNGLPHLMGKVASDAEEALGVLKWATREMDRRYRQFSESGVRDLRGYNVRMEREGSQPLPRVVIVIDELADLMMTAPYEVERGLCRLAQMARATGIHLVVATQRPSVDVVTGLIKANFPARIAFAVAQQVDSRVILDTPGAERLLGRGDSLYLSPTAKRLTRTQGCFVSDEEIAALVSYWRKSMACVPEGGSYAQGQLWSDEEKRPQDSRDDPLFAEALEVVKKEGRASTTMLQRHLRVGYTRASRLMDAMVARGIVSAKVDGPFASRNLLAGETSGEPKAVEANEVDGE